MDAWTTSAQSDTSSLSGTTTGAYTPTHTTSPSNANANANAVPLPVPFSTDAGVGSAPEAGGTYMIRQVDTCLALTLSHGDLVLRADVAGADGGWRWRCSESEDGWLRFRETVSGMYLRWDGGAGGFCAKDRTPEKKGTALLLRPREAGGCNVFAMHWWTLVAMTASGGGGEDARISDTKNVKEASRWEFVRV
ncbi:hypothetical protein F4811DRAFT_505317 [Daldinia bambusicola]|nr:hypothetical protein F4811DRAFT_505317 [Daldinia bambusicola]